MSAVFSLQVNDSGAWRNVVKGSKDKMESVDHLFSLIASIMGKQYKWRIIDAAFGTVIGYCNETTNYEWRPVIDGGQQ